MDIAVISDIHGNLPALEAVLADLRNVVPDLVLHGGDLAAGGSSPVEVVDLIRELGWPGVMGNADQMLVESGSLEEFASRSAAPAAMWTMIREMAAATRSVLGDERLAWLRELPLVTIRNDLAVVHAVPESCWLAPAADSSDAELEDVYGLLGAPVVAFGHTHLPFIRTLPGTPRLLINMGSVGMPYDGDPRASYLLLRDGVPEIRRVEYDVERELKLLAGCGLPGADWAAKMLRASSPQIP